MNVLWTVVLFAPLLVAVPFYTHLIRKYWLPKNHLKGRVYMHRRNAMSWSVLMMMDTALLVSALAQWLFFGVPWWSLLTTVPVLVLCFSWAYWQRGVQLRKMRIAEDAEAAKIVIPDHIPEDL